MNARLAVPLALAALAALHDRSSAADEGPRVVAFGVAALDGEAAPPADAARSAAAIVAQRCRHAGFEGVTAEAKDGAVELRIPAALAASEAAMRLLAERRGAVEFRVRAATSVEDEWRDRRLQAGTAPPAGLVWCEPSEGASKLLVEAPERAAAARLDDARRRDPADPAAVKSAADEVERVRREAVFGNADVASATVQRSMRSWGAQRFLHVAVRFELKEERRAAFEKFTGERVGRALCVVVDGKVRFCAPIPAAMPGSGELRGPGTGYTEEEAQELAALLESAPLPCRLVRREAR